MLEDTCGLYSSYNCPPFKYNHITHSQFVRLYHRLEESEKDEKQVAATFENLTTAIETMAQNIFKGLSDGATIITRVICLAYLANFYYTALQDRKKTSALFDAVTHFLIGTKKHACWKTTKCCHERSFPLFITNKLSAIFDEHFRTVLGLVTLHRSIDDSLKGSSTVLVRICPVQLLKYLKIQCNRWEGVDEPVYNEIFKCNHTFHGWYDTYEPLSEVFMASVLRASSCKT